jgi:hypothetical protein
VASVDGFCSGRRLGDERDRRSFATRAQARATGRAAPPRRAHAGTGTALPFPNARSTTTRAAAGAHRAAPLREKLELARDLMRQANPLGDLAVILERAVDLLVAELQKQRQGLTSRPQKKPRSAKDTEVTSAARREVVARGGWRCSFVADDGRRCNDRGFLEYDHEIPKGRGGSSGAKNLRLLCRPHNRLAAERVFGKTHVSCAIAASRSKTGNTAGDASHRHDGGHSDVRATLPSRR